MFSLIITVYRFFKTIQRGMEDDEFRGLFYLVLIMLGSGAAFYHFVEGWGWIDSLYFAVITLSTIGYGDFSPATAAGRIFTIFYVLIGMGLLFGFITRLSVLTLEEPGLEGHLLAKFRGVRDKVSKPSDP